MQIGVPSGCAGPFPPGEEGLLLVKGPNRMAGYWARPEETAAVLRDGWYVTGDVGSVDEDGFLRITDRLARSSKIGGEMVSHGEVESVVQGILPEGACAVTSVPDERKGERLVVIYAAPGVPPEELSRRLRASGMPRLRLPRRGDLVWVSALPMLPTGKLDLRALRESARRAVGETSARGAA